MLWNTRSRLAIDERAHLGTVTLHHPPFRPGPQWFLFLSTGPNWVWTTDWINGTNHYLDH